MRTIVIGFGTLGLLWYTLSGGAEFEPGDVGVRVFAEAHSGASFWSDRAAVGTAVARAEPDARGARLRRSDFPTSGGGGARVIRASFTPEPDAGVPQATPARAAAAESVPSYAQLSPGPAFIKSGSALAAVRPVARPASIVPPAPEAAVAMSLRPVARPGAHDVDGHMAAAGDPTSRATISTRGANAVVDGVRIVTRRAPLQAAPGDGHVAVLELLAGEGVSVLARDGAWARILVHDGGATGWARIDALAAPGDLAFARNG